MLIVCGMQIGPARYTSPVQNHLSQNVAARIKIKCDVAYCELSVQKKKKEI